MSIGTGMLWFDNDPKSSLAVKVIRAADYYKKKYGKVPNKCYINPKDREKKLKGFVNGIKIFTSPTIITNHIWIGREVQQGE